MFFSMINLDPGISLCNVLPCSGIVTLSLSPQRMTVGTLIFFAFSCRSIEYAYLAARMYKRGFVMTLPRASMLSFIFLVAWVW